MTLALVVSLVFVAAGGVLLIVGGTAATAAAVALLGIAAVIWVSLAFFAVGRSEDRERAEAAAAREARAAKEEEPKGPLHKDEDHTPRFRRRPG